MCTYVPGKYGKIGTVDMVFCGEAPCTGLPIANPYIPGPVTNGVLLAYNSEGEIKRSARGAIHRSSSNDFRFEGAVQ
jgi:hypothetical protein